jgi:ABC-2 type transport system permease protein
MKWLSFEAVASVAYKEFLHIYRDRRVLLLVLTLPPLFTLLFGHAFETGELTGVPSLLVNQDNTPRAQEFIDIISKNKTFDWRRGSSEAKDNADLVAHGVQATLVIPAGWNESLENGDPKPLLLYLDGSDINTADAVEGSVRQSLGDFQLKQRDQMIENLPEEVFELGKQLPVQIRKRFVSIAKYFTTQSRESSTTSCPASLD